MRYIEYAGQLERERGKRERALHNSVQVDIYKHEAGRAQQMRSNIHHPRKFRYPDPRARLFDCFLSSDTLCSFHLVNCTHTHRKEFAVVARLDLSTTYTIPIEREREMNGNDITRYRPNFY